jgi:anaerobic ribonucleoside-triphosphate reductase
MDKDKLSHVLRVDLEPDSDPKMVGQEYRATVMAYKGHDSWNSGCVFRAGTPEEAFKGCMDLWKEMSNYKSPEIYGHEWTIDCPSCGVFTAIQKGDPVICPKCGNTDIDTVRKV